MTPETAQRLREFAEQLTEAKEWVSRALWKKDKSGLVSVEARIERIAEALFVLVRAEGVSQRLRASRLRAFVRQWAPGQCKMLSLGQSCDCLLCDIDALVRAEGVSPQPTVEILGAPALPPIVPLKQSLETLQLAIARSTEGREDKSPRDRARDALTIVIHDTGTGSVSLSGITLADIQVDLETRLAEAIADAEESVFTRLRSAAPVPQWQPIESAPKDGTKVLLFGEDGIGMGFFDPGVKGHEDQFPAGWRSDTFNQSCWMPLPPAPVKETP